MSATPPQPPEERPPTLLQTIGSVLASFFGVQSSANRRRDFTRGNPVHFIVIGLLATVGVIASVWLVVKLALRSAGL